MAGTPVTVTGASLSNEFPQQIAIGGYNDFTNANLRVVLEYVFTHYAKNRQFGLGGSATGLAAAAVPLSGLPVIQNWKNQHNARIGFERNLTENMMGRFGYVLTSQVTPSSNARATFSAPGLGHTFTAGAGYKMNETFDVNWALEFSAAGGTGEAPALTGDYKSRAAAFHLGLGYRI